MSEASVIVPSNRRSPYQGNGLVHTGSSRMYERHTASVTYGWVELT